MRDNKDMSNKMTDYQKELEAYAQKKLVTSYAKRTHTKPFPTNKILVALVLLAAWTWFYGPETLEQASKFSPPALKSRLTQAASTLSGLRNKQVSEAQVEAPLPAPNPPADIRASQKAAAAVTNEAHQASMGPSEPADIPMVRIEGRWYPKSSDNIYLINGKRILYIDNLAGVRATPDKEKK